MSYTITLSIPDEWIEKLLKKENMGLDSSKIREYILKILERDLEGE